MTATSNLLFVYGTLQSSFVGIRMACYLGREADLLGPARVAGRLYGLRCYPGLRPPLESGDWVHGELYRIRKPHRVLSALDEYEASEFRRVLRPVWFDRGATVDRAWTYLFTQPLAQHRRISSGKWPENFKPHLLRRQSPNP